MKALKERIREMALAQGFVRAGFASAAPLPHQEHLQRWLDRGMAGEMAFMDRYQDQRHNPRQLLPQAESVLVVAARYADGEDDRVTPGRGRVARYARGEDYHQTLRKRLELLAQEIQSIISSELHYRIAVDSAPLLEREIAQAAGIGFIGKNTLMISPGVGSYTVLGELLLSVAIEPDDPVAPRCGSCDLCIRACPTDALAQPYWLDARRCISYLTIEYRGEIAPELSSKLGDWVFGCDDCQQVCPFNSPTAATRALARDPQLMPAEDPRDDASGGAGSLDLLQLLTLRSGGYRRLVRQRALRRAPRRALRRNAALAIGNQAPPTAPHQLDPTQALQRASEEADPTLRGAAAWAIDQHADTTSSASSAKANEAVTCPLEPGVDS